MKELKEGHIAVEVPQGAMDISADRGFLWYWINEEYRYKDLPPGKWKYLFCTKDASEEQIPIEIYAGEFNGKFYTHAVPGALRPTAMSAVYTCATKKDSLASLIKTISYES